MGEEVKIYKASRILQGEKPRVLDLFSGCGGLSLGFLAAGFEIAGGVEMDPLAAKSHSMNLLKHTEGKEQALHSIPRDITKTHPHDLVEELKLGSKSSCAIDVLIGGPPCQAYSIVGRAKLREIRADKEAFKNDGRANLYLEFLNYVKFLEPIAVLIENVPEILRFGKKNVPEEISKALEEMGYCVRYSILNSVHYGVPQLRDRMFLIAYSRELRVEPTFPVPSHHYTLPIGYSRLRSDICRKHGIGGLFPSPHFVIPPENESKGLPAITAGEAIGDLPPIRLHLEGKLRRGPRRFTTLVNYSSTPRPGAYPHFMRTWDGFENNEGIRDHVIRYLPRDYEIFARMKPNDEYPAAYRTALKLLEERLIVSGDGDKPAEGTEEYLSLRKATVPPYDPKKFANKWRKLDPHAPSRTLTAHIGKDTYSHIHYDSSQARTISVREAARLQSFPDGFVFEGTLDPALRQIGNSVPPLLAKAIAVEMLRILKKMD